jgi:hypothetical protein
MKKFFQNPFAKRIKAFCAFCKTPRHVYRKKRIGAFDILACALGALTVMGLVFQQWDPRVFLFFVGFLAMAEIFIQLRWRVSVVCQHCGFDPLLYLKKPDEAAEKVKLHLERRKNDPATLLARPLNIPYRKVKPTDDAKPTPQKGRRLSKQV